jgi:hypothetical protein
MSKLDRGARRQETVMLIPSRQSRTRAIQLSFKTLPNTRGAKGALHVKCHTLTSFMNSGGDLPYILLET